MKAGRFKQWGAGIAAMALPVLASAQAADPKRWQLNMGQGVTAQSANAYSAHMFALWVCVVIGILVFGAMAYAMFKFRHSKGAVPDKDFTHSTKLEVVWTVVPVVLLVLMAFPATSKLIKMYDTRNAEMTVKITGYQWMWKYDYLGENVGFTSRLDRKSDEIRQSGKDARDANHPHYLLDVDNVLVLPTDTKIRFVITADDVIHAGGCRRWAGSRTRSRASSTKPGRKLRSRASTAASARNCAARTTASCRSWSRPCRRPNTSSGSRRRRRPTRRLLRRLRLRPPRPPLRPSRKRPPRTPTPRPRLLKSRRRSPADRPESEVGHGRHAR